MSAVLSERESSLVPLKSQPGDLVASACPTPRVLAFFLSPQDSYRSPLFSSQEVFCGPDTEARTARDGRVLAVRTPAGTFDVAPILKQVPAGQKPELVVVKADATARNFPRNLAALRCPKILLVGDTHHLAQPLERVINYARSEPFDFIIFDHTRHHAHFFAEAGLRSLYWMPALDYGYLHREISAAPSRPLTFVGQAGRHHPWRRAVLDHVKAAGLPLEILRGTLVETADLYADSQITLNASLNGDLNLRVFESLAAGGFLLTDELSAASGLRLLFESGKHLDTWRTPGELVEKIRHYRAHPAEALRIRREGQAEILRAHHPDVKLRELYDLVFSGKVNPRYDLGLDSGVISAGAEPAGQARGAPTQTRRREAYETLQSLHQNAREVVVYTQAPTALRDLADLPRLRFAPLAELPAEMPESELSSPITPVLWWDGAVDGLADALARFTGRHVIAPQAAPTVAAELLAWGFTAAGEGSWARTLTQPVQWIGRALERGLTEIAHRRLLSSLSASHDSVETLAFAAQAEAVGDGPLQRVALEQAVRLDRNNQAAFLALAALSLDQNKPASTLVLLEEAARVGPLTEDVEALRADLERQTVDDPFMKSYYSAINRIPAKQAETPRRILVITNILPPQELGGYGRSIWEFAQGLRLRGHDVRVLTGNSPMLAKPPTADEREFEQVVSRRLQLLGVWIDGRGVTLKNPKEVLARERANERLIRTTIRSMNAELVLIGNLDFLGVSPINFANEAGLPVIQSLGNTAPGYSVADQPFSPLYCVGPCSNWTGAVLQQAGFAPARVETIYPGARIDRFLRIHTPDTRRLRLCYASLVLPYKGADTLVDALAHLHQRGVDFTAEIAGDAPEAAFLEKLQNFVKQTGMAERVTFTGFLDREGMKGLFARSNVLVFPSRFEEPFGISQVEAMISGLVVVSSATGGAREVIRDGVDGLVFPNGNANALADRLQSLATKPELFARLQEGGQGRAAEFSVDQAVNRIEQIFEEMLEAKASAAFI
jgi:glycosyltransferase involved in cell wall biosynthesis